jgi:hypothetical protein
MDGDSVARGAAAPQAEVKSSMNIMPVKRALRLVNMVFSFW